MLLKSGVYEGKNFLKVPDEFKRLLMTDDDDSLSGTDSLPEYATPNPHPSRAIYGMEKLLVTCCLVL